MPHDCATPSCACSAMRMRRTKYACYTANFSMSVVATLSPLLFLTFHTLYQISFALLGTLVLINFCTQLFVDLLFSFYSHKFNIEKMVRLMPVLTVLGLFVYAVFPALFPQSVYVGLAIGTVIFAASGGLAEVLISPVIAAMPSENPQREMSKLHSIYAWGVVAVVIVSTLFLWIFGKNNWQWLALFWTCVPFVSCVLFAKSEIPSLQTPQKATSVRKLLLQNSFLLCVLGIFLGGASECAMAQWSSSYLEQALHIPKIWGDVCGVAMFAVMLGAGRTLYAKYGKNIRLILCCSAAGATVCYLTAALSNDAIVALVACALTGFCTAMLWPGSLMVVAEQFPNGGVAVFALMAAGGDLGGALGPQIVGAVTDFAMQSEAIISFAQNLHFTADQFGMKIGLISAGIFPLLATVLFAVLYQKHGKQKVYKKI